MSDAERPDQSSPGLDLGPVPAPASEPGARILARALTYQLPDGSGGATIRMPEIGVHCREIMESRHVDVLEMDAASHNGVDDVRQINEAVRYAPVMARYKVYILDEVHMLSGAAFNALLKTLEEPPPHAKFVFATTEIRKVPVTVLSRCQRFDLRRVEAGRLMQHLEGIAGKEGIAAEGEALALIARAAEGSVRDALSLFDQAIAHSGLAGASAGTVRAEDVRQMLGLADRARIIDLFEALMRGDIAAALKELRDQYESGADPAVALADLAEFTHFVTRVKVVPAVADDPSLAEGAPTRGRAFATALSMRVLSRTWQMLLRGIPDVQSAVKPIAAAEMVLVRIAYAADLPTPDEVIRSLGEDNGAPAPARPAGNGGIAAAPGTAASAPALRADGPRPDAPRASLAPRSAAAAAPGAIAGAAAGTAVGCDRPLRGPDRACRRAARPADQIRARARRAAGAFRGRQARDRARAGRHQDAGQRSFAQARRLDRAPVARRGLGGNRRAHGAFSGRGARGRAEGRRARRSAGAGGAR